MSSRLEIPIIVADTSALHTLMELEEASDQLPPEQAHGGFRVGDMIDAMCIKGKRTMIMPASILTEMFPTNSGRLHLAMDEHDNATFPLGEHYTAFEHSYQLSLYQYLSHLAQDGHVRCYNNCADMLQAGEIDNPKGGIVFVDMGEERRPTGRAYSPRKVGRLVGTQEERTSEYPNHSAETPKTNPFKDEGDRDIFALTNIIDNHIQKFGINHRLLLLNLDGGLYDRYRGTPISHGVGFMKPLPLIDALSQLGVIDSKTTEVVDHALRHLAQENPLQNGRPYENQQTEMGRNFRTLDAEKARNWLERTARPEEASNEQGR